MKLAIIGSRTFQDYHLASTIFDEYFTADVDEIISGGANGADKIGAKIAQDRGINLTEFLPEWDKYGKRAGFIRNEDIIKNSDAVLCFWDGISKGTGNSLSIAKRLKKQTHIIYF